MWHLDIIFIHQCLCKLSKVIAEIRGYTALVIPINSSVPAVPLLIILSVVPQRCRRKYIKPGLTDCVFILFGKSRWRFHSFAMSVISFRRILIKQNLAQSNKAGSLGSNFSKSTKSWKIEFYQPGLSAKKFWPIGLNMLINWTGLY